MSGERGAPAVDEADRWVDRFCPHCGGQHRARLRPAMQFYPADEQKETALRLCKLAARGLWHEMLNLMHQAVPRGWLVTSTGKQIDAKQLARMVGENERTVGYLLDELEEHGVFSRTDEGIIYSRRMVRDEHISNVRAASGKKGGNPDLLEQTVEQIGAGCLSKSPDLVNHSAKQTDNHKPTPSSAAAAAAAASSSDLSKAEAERRAAWRCLDPATATAPPACWSDLGGNRLRLLVAFYGNAPPDVQRDKGEQMRALLSAEGVRWGPRKNAQRVNAGSVERLERKCAETLDEMHQIRKRGAAMAYLIRKVADTSDETMPAQLAEAQAQRDRQREKVDTDADYAVAESWAAEHPEVASSFESNCRREGWTGPLAQQMRRAHVLGAWRRKGSPGDARSLAVADKPNEAADQPSAARFAELR